MTKSICPRFLWVSLFRRLLLLFSSLLLVKCGKYHHCESIQFYHTKTGQSTFNLFLPHWLYVYGYIRVFHTLLFLSYELIRIYGTKLEMIIVIIHVYIYKTQTEKIENESQSERERKRVKQINERKMESKYEMKK